jgi:hypothetical protein
LSLYIGKHAERRENLKYFAIFFTKFEIFTVLWGFLGKKYKKYKILENVAKVEYVEKMWRADPKCGKCRINVAKGSPCRSRFKSC